MSNISYQSSRKIQQGARKPWVDVFKELFGGEFYYYADKEDYIDFQKTNNGDGVIYFRNYEPKTIELKTASKKNHDYFVKHGTITLEIMGNMEENKLGSSIFACQADLFGYGFLVNGQIKDWIVIWLKDFKPWFEGMWKEYEITTPSTDGLYHTKCVKVPMNDLNEFRCWMPYENL